ncbi:hypothetical protein [Micromonospora sp. WMMD975]|uniref:hypothetical protein n=1 Tax=Micromonospora sp. WMMD975 TaxID=3016087 RepID=UPI00249C4CED|nr:hypothetical protein [Micromonospora sp. WMMD975]WFE31757.1 hypothetical protein O7613_19400 [Micromonospora sp. WMMD975]
MQVRINGIDRDLTAAEAQSELAARKAAKPAPSSSRAYAVPTDAFTVSMTLNYDLYLNRVVTGSWNFRDNYVNGSDPDDVATIQTNLGGGCFRTGSLVRHAADYTGADYTGQTGASGCGSTKLGAQFQYEHNQDGSGGFSASAGWGVFSIS